MYNYGIRRVVTTVGRSVCKPEKCCKRVAKDPGILHPWHAIDISHTLGIVPTGFRASIHFSRFRASSPSYHRVLEIDAINEVQLAQLSAVATLLQGRGDTQNGYGRRGWEW